MLDIEASWELRDPAGLGSNLDAAWELLERTWMEEYLITYGWLRLKISGVNFYR